MGGAELFTRIERLTRRAMALLGENAPAHDEVPDKDVPELGNERLTRLVSLCGLDSLAVDVLICLVAVEFDPFMRTVVRALQRELGKPWIEIGTMAELLALPPPHVPELGRLFAPHGPLRKWGLVRVDAAAETPL